MEEKAEDAEDMGALKEVFEQIGFEDVIITKAPLPEHLRKWVAQDLDEDETIDEIAEVLKYHRIETRQGSFGIFFGAYPALDLEGSGVTLAELEPELAAEAPPEFPQITGFSGESEQLLQLYQLMVKSKG